MSIEFFFYYGPGNFPADIINRSYGINPNFEFESHRLADNEEWSLIITYNDYSSLSTDDLSRLIDVYGEFGGYDGYGYGREHYDQYKNQ